MAGAQSLSIDKTQGASHLGARPAGTFGVYAKTCPPHDRPASGVQRWRGHAYELLDPAIEALSMEERMTLCNMRLRVAPVAGYVNPDATTCAYLQRQAEVRGRRTGRRFGGLGGKACQRAEPTFDD